MNEHSIGRKMYALAADLYPICRSITGDGVRQTLKHLQQVIPLQIFEVPSGTEVFDWEVPREWNVRDAWIKDPSGKKIINFQEHNLHLLNYSLPIHQKMDLATLKPHLYTLPEQPEHIPYRTSYYQENWGFCLAHRQYEELKDGIYEIFIDTTLEDGFLTYGELLIPGTLDEEVLFSAHICHPSLANDNLSGIGLLTYLAEWLLERENRYTYRFLFIPGTIGSITWLAQHESEIQRIKHGLVVSLVGDAGAFTYKKSRRGNATIDRAVQHVLEHSGYPFQVIDFFPYGYDERQFCSPGFNLPIGNLTRSQFGQYPEYHTSADDLQLIRPEYLEASFSVYQQVVEVLEGNIYPYSLNPKCEPQLGKRGLYAAIGGQSDQKALQMAMLWLLNLADGDHSLLDIAERAAIPFSTIQKITQILMEKKLLKGIPELKLNPSDC
jgi:aminopeptidase-like protein